MRSDMKETHLLTRLSAPLVLSAGEVLEGRCAVEDTR